MENAQTLERIAIDALISLATACAQQRGCRLSTISRLAHGDPVTLDKIRQGKASITLRKWEQAMTWLRDPSNWPEGATIPKVYEPWRRAPRRPAAAKRRGGSRRAA